MPDNLYPGTIADLEVVTIDAPLENASNSRVCEYYFSDFQSAAQVAERSGDSVSAAVYVFLARLCSFFPSFDTPATPFGPPPIVAGRRNMHPADLTEHDLSAMRILAGRTKDAALRARMNDILWIQAKEHRSCACAAAAYIESAERLNTPEDWTFCGPQFSRALFLAGLLGRNKPLYEQASQALLSAIERAKDDNAEFWLCSLLTIAVERRVGELGELALLAQARAEAYTTSKYFHAARAYRDVEESLWIRAKQLEQAKKAAYAEAETYIAEAESRADSAMVTSSLLEQGIVALRKARASDEYIESLRQRLKTAQQGIAKEMQPISVPIDHTDAANAAARHVTCDTLKKAVLRLAFVSEPTDLNEVRKSIEDSAKLAPMSHLIGSVRVDGAGRTVTKSPGVLGLSGEALEQAMTQECYAHASQYHWFFRANGRINPARIQVYHDHHPSLSDLEFLVRHNPIIPPGHEHAVLRGIHAGFHGDFLVSCHLLASQIEGMVRHILASREVLVTVLNDDGTEPVNMLGAMLDKPECKQIFGDAWLFELRGCLIEKSGWNFRNRIAHGLVSDGECFSPVGITLWWLVLRLLVTPLVAGGFFKDQQASDPEPEPTQT